jgi:hypothetical protein
LQVTGPLPLADVLVLDDVVAAAGAAVDAAAGAAAPLEADLLTPP